MKEILRTYNTQFTFQPEIKNEHLIHKNFKHLIVCGMGGSHLAAGILKTIKPDLDIYVHSDYDVPAFSKSFLESSLLVASSYSGNTEEVLSFYKKIKQVYELPVLCIAMGGELLEQAIAHNDPYIVLPQTEFVPRTALGITTCALASVYKDKEILHHLHNLILPIDQLEQEAQIIASQLRDATPVFYASTQNIHLAYNWKIKCNETAKQMAFYNVFPEANHNEIEAYGHLDHVRVLPVLLEDSQDHMRIIKRFKVFKSMLEEKNIPFISIDISENDIYKKIFNTIVLGDFVTARIAENKGLPQAQVPYIEEFKKKLV